MCVVENILHASAASAVGPIVAAYWQGPPLACGAAGTCDVLVLTRTGFLLSSKAAQEAV